MIFKIIIIGIFLFSLFRFLKRTKLKHDSLQKELMSHIIELSKSDYTENAKAFFDGNCQISMLNKNVVESEHQRIRMNQALSLVKSRLPRMDYEKLIFIIFYYYDVDFD